ncbi:hypothetical protein TNCV_4936041 [Trichonephila clavipes]|nr:hypothetical protein TNCV_4936041 [Trichonephila clavipes]
MVKTNSSDHALSFAASCGSRSSQNVLVVYRSIDLMPTPVLDHSLGFGLILPLSYLEGFNSPSDLRGGESIVKQINLEGNCDDAQMLDSHNEKLTMDEQQQDIEEPESLSPVQSERSNDGW